MTPINLLANSSNARITLPLAGRRTLTLDCYPKDQEPPFFVVGFDPGQLPCKDLDLHGQCMISFDAGNMICVIQARIDEVLSEDRLRLATVKSYTNTQKREYFRVDTELFVQYQHEQDDSCSEPTMQRVNLSGSGIRFPVDRRFHLRDTLNLKLFFDQFLKLDARCIGQIVRIDETDQGDLEVSLHFVDISPADRDKIISYCFARQREMLRKRVKVKADS